MGKQKLVKTIFAADHNNFTTTLLDPLNKVEEKYATKESVNEIKDGVCNLVSSVRSLERERRVEKRRRWRNAMKLKRR